MMIEPWRVFYDAKTGRELMAYTLRGSYEGEEEKARTYLAEGQGIDPERIKTRIERRATHEQSRGYL